MFWNHSNDKKFTPSCWKSHTLHRDMGMWHYMYMAWTKFIKTFQRLLVTFQIWGHLESNPIFLSWYSLKMTFSGIYNFVHIVRPQHSWNKDVEDWTIKVYILHLKQSWHFWEGGGRVGGPSVLYWPCEERLISCASYKNGSFGWNPNCITTYKLPLPHNICW